MRPVISPSMMCADILSLGETLEVFRDEGVEYLHIDVMDGHFVPNFTLGTDYIKRLKQITDIPLDIHLMTERPEEKLGWFAFGPGDIVSVHAESTPHLHKALSAVRERGALAFAAINPGTPFDSLLPVLDDLDGAVIMCVDPGFAGQKLIPACVEKIRYARTTLDLAGREDARIEVDGNVSFDNAVIMRKAGADIFVAGTSSVFTSVMPLAEGVREMRRRIGG